MEFEILTPVKQQPAEPGLVLVHAGLAREALPFLKEKLALEPDSAKRIHDLGMAYLYAGEFEDAESLLRKANGIDPGQPPAIANHALALESLGRFGEALELWERCWMIIARLGPGVMLRSGIDVLNIAYPTSLAYLRFGKNEQAWPFWMARYRAPVIEGIPVWSGESLEGKRILVSLAECGFGDVFWLMRYLPKLQERGAQVTLCGRKSMRNILAGHPWIDAWLDEEIIGKTEDYDFQTRIWNIMAILNLCPLGMDGPYIKAEPYAPRGERTRIGICWKAEDSTFKGHKTRLITEESLELFRDLPAQFVSLQYGERAPEWIESIATLRGWEDTAQIVAGCDLIISVDTAQAHLAGAMGKETLVLVPCSSDWKMGLGTNASPWYPTWKLFRSNDPLGSKPAVEAIVRELKTRLISQPEVAACRA